MGDSNNSARVRPHLRYGVACVAALATLLLRYALVQHFGIALPPFVLFYPIILTVALFAGFRAGVLVTVIATLLTHHATFLTRGRLATAGRTEAMATAVFFVLGLFVCTLVDRYRYLLRRDEMRYRSLFENMAEGLAYCKIQMDDAGRPVDFVYLEVNRAFVHLTGLKNVTGKRVSEAIPGIQTSSPELIETYGRVALTGQSEYFEYYLDLLGKWFSVMAYCPKPNYFIAVFEDITERRRTEENLLKSRKFNEKLIANIGDTLLTFNEEGFYTYMSSNVERTWGWKAEELIGVSILKNIHPDDVVRIKHFIETNLRVPFGAGITELRYLRKDGEYRWMEASTRNLLHDPDIQSYVCNFHEITERKLAETEMIRAHEIAEESNRQLAAQYEIFDHERKILRTFIDNVPDLMYVKDLNSRFILTNAALARSNGVETTGELLGKWDFDFFPKEQAQSFYEDERQVIRSGQPLIDQEEISTDPDGKVRCILTNKVPLFDSKGQVIGIAGIGRNITAQKKIEAELVHAREAAEEATRQLAAEHEILDRERKILRTFIDNSPDVMFIKDTESRFILANAATARWNGKNSYEELIGKTDYDCLSKEAADFYYESEQRLMREGKPLLNQERSTIDRETGEKRYALSNKVPLYDNEGRVMGLACIERTITERKQAEAEAARLQEQLQQSHKLEAIGQLAGGISHDFNNLLMVIMAQTELLSLELDGVAAERASNVMKSAKRAAKLTGQLLAFSRKQPIQPRVFTINRLVSGISDMLERLVGEDIDVLVSLCDEPWTVQIDRVQFEQVIMNLVLNARDAMPEGGRLTIETGNIEVRGEYVATHPLIPAGNYALLAVSDNGTGMDDETRSHIFEPFFTTKEPGKGTGLGLSMVYGIVKQGGGFIWAYSEPGKGTCFKIYLPKVESIMATLPKTLAPTVPRSHKSATILLVEDEDALRKIIGEFLLSAGHQVIEVASVDDAYQAAMERRLEIELMLTDVVLRGGNGRKLANRLLEQGCKFPVIYMSGYTSDAIVHHGVLDFGTLFLQKPFSRTTLLAKVEQALSMRTDKD
jgi:PAS domain S-box-containing protein